jgi:hypothetical protein
MKATLQIKKSLKKGVIYPNELASIIVEETKTPKNTTIAVNAILGKGSLKYKEVKSVYKDISTKQKEIEDPTTDTADKQKMALTSMVATSINNSVKESLPDRTLCIWVASSSDNPSIDHVANYGEEFYLDEGIDGEIPGQRPNCQCGYIIKSIPKDEEIQPIFEINRATKSTIDNI